MCKKVPLGGGVPLHILSLYKATVIKFIVSQAIFCLIGMCVSAIYYLFLLINDLCTNTRKECSQGLELQEIVIWPL